MLRVLVRPRPSLIDTLLYLIGLLIVADVWLDPPAARIIATVLVLFLLFLVAMKQRRVVAEQRSAHDAEEAATATRAENDAKARVVVTEAIHAIVVEVVAAQQAVVRGAFADDILTRLTAADDNAHTALETLTGLSES